MAIRISANNLLAADNFQQPVGSPQTATPIKTIAANETLPPVSSANPNEIVALRRGIDSSAQKRFVLQNQLTVAQTAAEPEKPVFKTFGGTWRKDSEDAPRFYRDSAKTAGTARFDEEYYHPDPQKYPQATDKWIHLNASGVARDLPENKDKPRPENVSAFDWQGYEWIDEKNVPADYATSGKTITFAQPELANNQLSALKRYVVENDLAPGMWDEAKFNNIFAGQAGTEIKLEVEKTGEVAGKTVFNVRIDAEGLTRLRAGLAQYREEVGQDAAGGTESGKEETRLGTDTVGLYYETGRKIFEGAVNVVQDSFNAVLFPPFSERTGSEPNFGRAKVGEMYDELANRQMTPTNGSGPLPRIDTTPLKYDFQSGVMRRGVFTGKVDDGIKMGDAVTTGASIIAPLVVGKVLTPSTPLESLNLPQSSRVELAKVGQVRAIEVRATMTNRERGPVLTILRDQKTGATFEGLNLDDVPKDLHPVLQKRLEAYIEKFPDGKYPHYSKPGSHSEIIAADKALKAREAAGMKVTEANLQDFVVHNEWLTKKPGTAPMCPNCNFLLPEVKSYTGRRTQ